MAPQPERIECWRPEPAILAADLEGLGEVLHACVHGGASVSFVLPFTLEEARAFWRDEVLPAVAAGSRVLLLARSAGRIVGTVQLDLDTPSNQKHRAEVKKLLVHPEVRGRGIARSLMTAVEDQARTAGRTLLTLDTATGSAAESLYVSLGYVVAGRIPQFARRVDSGELESTTIMYKKFTF